jgi:cell division protein FtsL
MFKLANTLLVLATLMTASVLYALEYDIRSLERSISKEKLALLDETESIKLLNAEWSSLTRPERIQALAQQHLGLVPLQPDQVVPHDELTARLKDMLETETTSSISPIDDVLKKMQ